MHFKLILISLFCHINADHVIEPKDRLIIQKIDILEYNKKYLTFKARVDKINETIYAANFNFSLLEDYPETTSLMRVFALLDGTYRPMPISLKRNVCDLLKVELKWIQDDLKDYRIPTCPLKKGDYYIRNFVMTKYNFPFASPWEYVKLRISFSGPKNVVYSLFDIYGRFDKKRKTV